LEETLEFEGTSEGQDILMAALHGLIPCLWVLANRHIGNSSQCQICNIAGENILHTLFSCG
jgi:hypothetical protein